MKALLPVIFFLAAFTSNAQDSLFQAKSHLIDSVLNKPSEISSDYMSRIERLHQKLSQQIDSLTKVPDVQHGLLTSMDSLRSSLDTLKTSLAGKGQQYISNVQAMSDRVNEKIGALENKVNNKIAMFSATGAKVRAIDLPGFKMTSMKGLKTNTSIPGLNIKLDNLKIPSANLKIGGLDKFKNPIKIPAGKIPDLKDLPGSLEEKLSGLDAVKEFQSNTINYSELMKKWQSDPDVAKEMLVKAAKEQSVNHFEGHLEELQAAMDKMSGLKSKTKDAEAMIDMFKKRTNVMMGRSFRERLIFGGNLQVQASTHQWMDFNPYFGYRWSTRWTTGLGWNERLATDFKMKRFVAEEHIYGLRSFAEFKIREGIHARGEIEYMNAPVTAPVSAQVLMNEYSRHWVWSYMAGLKKSFSLAKGWKGNAQVLYNLYNPDHRSPYMNRVNLRMGFELPAMKKKQ